MSVLQIEVQSHHFVLSGYDHPLFQKLIKFCEPLIQVETNTDPRKGTETSVTKVYAASVPDHTSMRFHINILSKFMEFVKQIGLKHDEYVTVVKPAYEPARMKCKMKEHIKPRDYQIPIVDFVVQPEEKTRVIGIQAGRGKTLTALIAAAKLGLRVAVVLPAMYAEQWYSDIQDAFKCTTKDIMFVRGLKNLRSVIQMARNGEYTQDFIIMSSTTMQLLIKEYETDPGLCCEMYCHPAELFELLSVGTRIVDECHRNIHLNIKMDLYTHLPKGVNLSATLENRDPFINRMYGMIYPKKDRYDGLEYDRYVDVYALEYTMRRAHKAKYKGFKGYYNHTRLEQWLLKNPKELDNYCEMIYQIVKDCYVVDRLEGQRCLIFAAFVEFCTYLTKYLQRKIPELKVGRYVSEDDYVTLLANDISVSTILSAGTGVDIPGLREVIMTTSIDSMQANEQAKGRLRRLKDFPDVTPRFWYIYCTQIPKQVDYHRNKEKQFRGTCRYFKQIQTDYTVATEVPGDYIAEPFLLEGNCFLQDDAGYFDQHVQWIPYDEAA